MHVTILVIGLWKHFSPLATALPSVSIHPDFVEDGRNLLRRHPEWAKRVRKALDQLAANPRHPDLRTKRYADGVWQSYVANNTPELGVSGGCTTRPSRTPSSLLASGPTHRQ